MLRFNHSYGFAFFNFKMKDGILVSSARVCILKAEGWTLMMLLTRDSLGKDTKHVSLLL